MSLIDDIKRDREAGTPGPWKWDDEQERLTPVFSAEMSQGYGFIDWSDSMDGPNPAQPNMDRVAVDPQANARRIARVPDMEAALLVAHEALRKIANEPASDYAAEITRVDRLATDALDALEQADA